MAQAPLQAPFAVGGPVEIDAQLSRRLLERALSQGGDYADLYFEYRAGADYSYEDEKVKSVGRGITLGLGVRVLKGEATGYAYCEELTWEAMAEVARTAAQIAASGSSPAPIEVRTIELPNFYPVAVPTLETLAPQKLELLRRGDRAARKASPKIIKVQ